MTTTTGKSFTSSFLTASGPRSPYAITSELKIHFDISKCILSSEVIAYGDLGPEAVRKLEVKDFPVVVVIDSQGNNLYETAARAYAKEG